jgi:hypothetical protein
MSEDRYGHGGSEFPSMLLTLFIGLKLCGVINWSWWWVMSPLWITLGLVVIIALAITHKKD